MLYLLCTFLDLSVVELAEHRPRPFGQGMCGAPLSSFRTWGAAVGGKAGSLLETSKRLVYYTMPYNSIRHCTQYSLPQSALTQKLTH